MTVDMIEQDPVGSLDRSNCTLPPSSLDSTLRGRGTVGVKLDFVEQQRKALARTQEFSFQTLVKASWILTLQCFVVADIICFTYDGPLEPHEEREPGKDMRWDLGKRTLARYFTRMNSSELVQSFLRRLGSSCSLSDTALDLAGHDIGVADGCSTRHQCNTRIFFRGRETGTTEFDVLDSSNCEDDVVLVVGPSKSLESVKVVYRLGHTSKDMATSILNTFQHVYSQLANASAHTTLRSIDECSRSDRDKIQRWTYMDPRPAKNCLHDLILEQCRLRPSETAVCSWDGNLTYKELDDLSSRLAHHLIGLGVGPEVFVLSCFEKSTWAIVTRLAILRAGGAYISIFANNPPAYLDSVVSRTKTRILVTDSRFAERFRGTVPILVELSLEWLRTTPLQLQACNTAHPSNACLVLFTSGSTGTPKGIIQSHQAYVTAIKNYARDLQLGPHTRFLQFDDYAFDISNLEFLVPLIIGGCCCVPRPMKTIQDLALEINSLDADILFLTPTVAIKLEPSDVPRLKTMCVGGEPLPKDLISKWNGSGTKLVNQYGMGEVAICCALNRNTNPTQGAKVGRPSSGAIWVVNSSSPEKLIPIGAVGEILIEGPHLSRGYLDETAIRRTEAGFLKTVPRWMAGMHPDRIHTRIYRSGDLGRQNHDGTITYLGRKDTMLKLDGCRVDALEVEHQARKCVTDKDTIVVDLLGVINGQDNPSLTAFIHLDEHPISVAPAANGVPLLKDATTDSLAASKVKEIRETIAQSLLQYMIPTTFVLMSWIPRTASKKIDRKKIHMLGQVFYCSLLEQRPKDVAQAQKI